MSLLRRFNDGADISILNTDYHYPRKDPDTGKWNPDFINVLYKDNISGKKYNEIIYEPTYKFYMANDDVEIKHNMLYIDKNNTHQVECKFKDLEKTIADLTGNTEFFFENIRNGNRRANRQLHTIPVIFSSDVNIEDHFRARFAQTYINNPTSITKGYFDIEVDNSYINGDFPQLGECPINAISYLDDKTNSMNVFLLRDINADNPLIQEFEDLFGTIESRNRTCKEIQQFIIDNVGGLEAAKKYKVDNLNFNIRFFNEEIQLISSFFKLVNKNSPDFLLAWNMAFDIPYIIERCKVLGVDPAIVLSDPNYEEKYAFYYVDEMHRNEYELRGDYYKIAMNTTLLDQLIQFASRRKGLAAFPNFRLDTAAEIITKGNVRKLSYAHITNDLSKLCRLNYWIFTLYNMMDTIAQRAIEETVKDIDFIYMSCLVNDTRYSKGHRQTLYIVNKARKFFYEKGYILGNNINTGELSSYMGAMVGDPVLNSDELKLMSGDQIFNVYDNCDDYDYKALYPSEAREHNTAPDTIIGKIFIDDKVHPYENPYHQEQYDRGGQFMEDLVTSNPLEFGKRWLHFAGVKELLEDIDEYYSLYDVPATPTEIYNKDGSIKPFTVRPNAPKDILVKPFIRLEDGEKIKPFTIFHQSSIVEDALKIVQGL